jgi:hypothetical protein
MAGEALPILYIDIIIEITLLANSVLISLKTFIGGKISEYL